MRIYTAHINKSLEDTVFVRDGMAWPCLVIPVAWMLWHRMWVPAAIVFACSLAIAAIGKVGGDQVLANLIGFGFQFLVAFEANDLRRWSLGKAGYKEAGLVAADNLAEAEIRYFASIDPEFGASSPADEGPAEGTGLKAPGRSQSMGRAEPGPIGIFPEATTER